jgi:hypothetical protein
LYGPDDFHPSVEGSYLAALVIYVRLSGHSPVALPARFALPGGSVVEIPASTAALLQETAAHVLAGTPAAGRRERTLSAALAPAR